MHLPPDEFIAAILSFHALIEQDGLELPERVRKTLRALDRLAWVQGHPEFATVTPEAHETDEPPAEPLRRQIERLYPRLGFYNVPDKVHDEIAITKCLVGDVIDDLVDIARELYGVRQLWERGHAQAARELFRFGYQVHWGDHLRDLQWALHHWIEEQEDEAAVANDDEADDDSPKKKPSDEQTPDENDADDAGDGD